MKKFTSETAFRFERDREELSGKSRSSRKATEQLGKESPANRLSPIFSSHRASGLKEKGFGEPSRRKLLSGLNEIKKRFLEKEEAHEKRLNNWVKNRQQTG